MRIPGPAGELHARRAAALREQEQRDDKNLKNIIQNEHHQRRGDEEEEGCIGQRHRGSSQGVASIGHVNIFIR